MRGRSFRDPFPGATYGDSVRSCVYAHTPSRPTRCRTLAPMVLPTSPAAFFLVLSLALLVTNNLASQRAPGPDSVLASVAKPYESLEASPRTAPSNLGKLQVSRSESDGLPIWVISSSLENRGGRRVAHGDHHKPNLTDFLAWYCTWKPRKAPSRQMHRHDAHRAIDHKQQRACVCAVLEDPTPCLVQDDEVSGARESGSWFSLSRTSFPVCEGREEKSQG